MPTILVIDDDPSILENIVAILEFHNFATLAAPNGAIGLQLAREHLPDLVLCDVMMPELDGYRILLSLRSDPVTSLIPLMLLSAKADRQSVRYGIELGADDYLIKPFTQEELISAVKTRLKRRQVIANHVQSELDELRASLFHTLPHELRTPLVAILGYSELLMSDGEHLERSEIVQAAGNINKAGKQLHHLVENFLWYAQLDALNPNPKRLEVLRRSYTLHPKAVIEEQARKTAKEYERALDLSLDVADAEAVQISEDNLLKIVRELVDNALKFSEAGTPVQVHTTTVANEFRLIITDHGRGMTPQQIAAFGADTQGGGNVYEQQDIGLGIVVVRALIELHDGSMTIESTILQGTTICVTLLLAQYPSLVILG